MTHRIVYGWICAIALTGLISPPAKTVAGNLNESRIFSPTIKTVKVYKEGFEMSQPIITVNSSERLVIAFDDLSENLKYFRYTFVHCESDWSTSTNLTPSDYIRGYREENIEGFKYSYNTMVHFIHYYTTFPTSNMSPIISGNYLLKVYPDNSEEELIFTWRFMVLEASPITLEGWVGPSPYPAEQTQRQQVNFLLRLNGFMPADPSRDLKVNVRQNDRWDNMLCNVKPAFFRGDEIDFRYLDALVFNGGNVYRAIDIKSLRYQSERIRRILYDTIYEVYMLDDLPRPLKNYILEGDINGRYVVRNEENATDNDTEAEYALVHLFLKGQLPDYGGSYHLLGELTTWNLDEESRLRYNPSRMGYEINLLLKQGYYNYLYAWVPPGKTVGDETVIEGNHRETENVYTVMIYYHPAGELYDRLISVTDISSATQ